MSLLLLFRSAGGGITYDETGRQVGPIIITPTNLALTVFGEIRGLGGWSVVDEFDRPDSTSMGPNWSEDEADPDFFSIVSGKLEIGDTGAAGIAMYVGPGADDFGPDQFAQGFLEGRVDPHGGLAVRLSGTRSSLNGYSLEVSWSIVSQDMTLTLRKYTNQDLSASPGPTIAFYNRPDVTAFPAAVYRLEIENVPGTGNAILRVYEGGVLRINYTDTTPHASGRNGFALAFGGGGTLVGPYSFWEGGSLRGIHVAVNAQDARAFDAGVTPTTIVVTPQIRDNAVFLDKQQVGPLVIVPAAIDRAVLQDSGQQALTILPSVVSGAVFPEIQATTITVVTAERDLAVFKDSPQGGIIVILPAESDTFIGGSPTFDETGRLVTARIEVAALNQLLAVDKPSVGFSIIPSAGSSLTFTETGQAGVVVILAQATEQYTAVDVVTVIEQVIASAVTQLLAVDRPGQSVEITTPGGSIQVSEEKVAPALVVVPSALLQYIANEFPTAVSVLTPTVKDIAALIEGQRETVVILPSAIDTFTSPLSNEFVTVVLVVVPGVGDVLFPIRFAAGGTRSELADRLAQSVQSATDAEHDVADRRLGHAVPDSHGHVVSARPRRSQRH